MRTMRRTAALLGAAVLLAGLDTATATAADPKVQSICSLDLGSITAQGNYVDQVLSAASPPVASERRVGPQVADPGETRASATWEFSYDSHDGIVDRGYAIYGTWLYSTLIARPPDGPWWGRGNIQDGMGDFTQLARSGYPKGASPSREYLYGLRNDGVLFRWKKDSTGFHALGSYAGFAAVKTMTLISQTATYDTLLATTRGGALYTIHIPVTSPLTPVVKVVRTSTWQGFEAIVAEKCGTQSTLLAAIDRDSGSAYLYAVGHASGTATVIQNLGKLPGTFNDPIYFLRTSQAGTSLNGE
ncbi:hypothetical protein [Kribbella sp. VKM Ac-2566]|uniref:hypothetical protein n=1 Tax=Kribbella sp. VKM Ac-2566 TaxID=2512218 RepID=UPI0010E5A8BF|nr:hypothetical protein [Kribbella sp. VKM Ac-2566]TDW91574.1 hypothetical protein EV647_5155 [Kribbella sp. VKM Ac-2566]